MTDSQISFAQGLQLFFIEKILTNKHTMGTEARSRRGIDFFSQWSGIVRQGRENDEGFPLTVRVPRGFPDEMDKGKRDAASREYESAGREAFHRKDERDIDLSFVSDEYREGYRPLLETRRFAPLFTLLTDADLGQLMRIEYPFGAAKKVAETLGGGKDADIVKEAVARALNKPLTAVAEKDCAEITELDLSESELEDLAPVANLTNLQELNLDGTQVRDVTVLAKLTNLQTLDLDGTQVSDVTPLANLTKLQRLDFSHTRVSDVTALANLTNLQELYLNRTEASDVTALANLVNLKWLYLQHTQVSDVTALANLTKLRYLDLASTQVGDVTAFACLTNLRYLDLRGTPVDAKQTTILQKMLPELKILR